ncbi:MAG: BrnT family toxin [Treponema sp.]|nr:BrnT family toxin [Treponema sp.]
METSELKLEWHEPKRLKTMAERGLDFGLAREVLLDPEVKEYVDNRKDYGEIRYRAYGLCSGTCLAVTYTMRDDMHRIISVRKVHQKEREIYYERKPREGQVAGSD